MGALRFWWPFMFLENQEVRLSRERELGLKTVIEWAVCIEQFTGIVIGIQRSPAFCYGNRQPRWSGENVVWGGDQ